MLKYIDNQRGETIVEVLICIAILTLGFTSAFLISNQSTNTTIENEATYQAQLYAQQQVSLLHVYVATDLASSVRSLTTPFFLALDPHNGTVSMSGSAPHLISATQGTSGLYYCVKTINLGRYDSTGNPSASGGRQLNYFQVEVAWDTNNDLSNPGTICNWSLPNHALGTLSEYYAI